MNASYNLINDNQVSSNRTSKRERTIRFSNLLQNSNLQVSTSTGHSEVSALLETSTCLKYCKGYSIKMKLSFGGREYKQPTNEKTSLELNRLGLFIRTIRSSRKENNLGWLNRNFYRLFKRTNTQLFRQVSMLAKSETLLLICTSQKSRERSRSTHWKSLSSVKPHS